MPKRPSRWAAMAMQLADPTASLALAERDERSRVRRAAHGGADQAPRLLTERALASAVRSRLAPRRLARGESELGALAAAHGRACAPAFAAAAPPGLPALCRAALARHLAEALENDAGDDLYFQGGRQRAARRQHQRTEP